MTEEKYAKKLEFPKPKKDGSGSTAQLGYSESANCVFMELAKQKEDTTVTNARFDYDNKIIMKLGAVDICEMLVVLDGKKDSINNEKGIFHQFEKDGFKVTSGIRLKRNDPKYGGFFLEVGKNENGEKKNVALRITDAESIMLSVILKTYLEKIFS